VPARDQQQQIRKSNLIGEAGRECMCFEMVDRHEGLAGDQCQCLGRGQAHHHAADEAGAGGCRDA
jgi:hypothetical protein